MKKKVFSILLMMALAISTFAQINVITRAKEPKLERVVQQYDSLQNINEENIMLHQGQTIFFKSNSFYKPGNQFHAFRTRPVYDDYSRNYLYKPVNTCDYESTLCLMNDYKAILGKYYYINRVDWRKNKYSSKAGARDYCLQLIEEEKKDTIYFVQDQYCHQCNAFVTIGYYEKMKELFVGKMFHHSTSSECNKAGVDETVKVPYKAQFKCVDVAVNLEKFGDVHVVLESKTYGQVIAEISKRNKVIDFISVSDLNRYVKQFGTYYADLIVQGKVVRGMNKKMAEASWGKPKDINTTTGSYGTHEQWVYYGDNYLYFENGKLTSIQN